MGRFIKEEFIDKTPEEIAEEERQKKLQEKKVINTLERRKERRLLIFFGIIVCCIPFILPTLNALFKQDSLDNYSKTMREIRKVKTIDGYMLIGNIEAASSVNKFSFYNVRRSGSNKIAFAYELTSKMEDFNSLNLYVEIYNKNKEIIYREKFVPSSDTQLNRARRYSKSLDSYTYEYAYYVKISEIKEVGTNNVEKLSCTQKKVKDTYNTDYQIDYTFSDNFLTKYEVIKSINGQIEEKDANLVSLKKEYNSASKEINATFNNNNLQYIVDYSKEYEEFKPIVEYGAAKDQITKSSISRNWSCE